MSKMGFVEAWEKCPGIPDYFFKDGSYFPNFSPRPVSVDLKNSSIGEIEFGRPFISCQEQDCSIEIPLKKFQLKILENQGYKIDEKILSSLNIQKPSRNAEIFFGTLQGSDRADVCLSKKDFSDIEGTFMDIFSYIFNYRVAQWIPVIQ